MTLQLQLHDGRVLVLPWYPNTTSSAPVLRGPSSPSRRSRSSCATVLDISSEVEADTPFTFGLAPVRDQLGVLAHLPEPVNPTDVLARQILLQDGFCFTDIDEVLNTLPAHVQSDRPIFQPSDDGTTSASPISFISGAYIHGPQAGLHTTMRQYPWLTQLLVCIVRLQVPDCFFSTVSIHRNCTARIHRDSHNHACIPNYIIPLSEFNHGHLWIENPQGTVFLNSLPGIALPISVPFVSFDPRLRHATLPWEGTRTVLVAFHIRSAWRLSPESLQTLQSAGFHVHVSDVRDDPYQ